MYCPSCFNNSLILNKKGVADILINKKQLDNGRLLFSSQTGPVEILESLEKKINEFFQWYSRFQNVEPIFKIEIISNNFICSNKCRMRPDQKFSVIDSLFTSDQLMTIVNKLAPKYQLVIQLKNENEAE